MSHKTIVGLSVALLVLLSGRAEAVVVLAGAQDPGTEYRTDSISAFVLTAHDMDGMKVTATFADGSTSMAPWADAGFSGSTAIGNAVGPDWILSLTSNQTYFGDWMLSHSNTASAMVSLVVSGAGGQTVFDIVGPGGPDLTEGSDDGRPFIDVGSDVVAGTATYRNRVTSGAETPPYDFKGDLYETLDIAFEGSGLAAGDKLTFQADTDNASTRLIAVPEPSSFLFLGMFASAGVVATGLKKRTRVKKEVAA